MCEDLLNSLTYQINGIALFSVLWQIPDIGLVREGSGAYLCVNADREDSETYKAKGFGVPKYCLTYSPYLL